MIDWLIDKREYMYVYIYTSFCNFALNEHEF